MDYLLRWFKDNDLETYNSGLNIYTYEDYDEEWFRWKFLDNHHNLGFFIHSSGCQPVRRAGGSTASCRGT